MSSLQYQLRELLPSLSSEAKKIKDPEVKQRYFLIRAVALSLRDVKKTCEARGESTSTFYKWSRKLIEMKSLEALKTASKKPQHSPNQIDPRIEKRICRIRRKYPFKGPDQILNELKKMNCKVIPHPSTIYNALKRNGFIKDGNDDQKKLTKKHMKRYRRPIPGYLQMDFKYVPYEVEGRQYYQLSCIDHNSSWRLIRCFPNKDFIALEDFLNELETSCPFNIIQIQTDNDACFTDKYRINTDGFPTGSHLLDVWCEERNIEHKLIPIGEKELNGKVENSHKWDDREHYSQIYPKTLYELQRLTEGYNERWNEERATKTLGWKTPLQVVLGYLNMAMFWKVKLHEELKDQNLTMTSLDEVGDPYIKVPQRLKAKNETKSQQPNFVDRYLKYMDWEKSQSNTVSAISPNFSVLCFGGKGAGCVVQKFIS